MLNTCCLLVVNDNNKNNNNNNDNDYTFTFNNRLLSIEDIPDDHLLLIIDYKLAQQSIDDKIIATKKYKIVDKSLSSNRTYFLNSDCNYKIYSYHAENMFTLPLGCFTDGVTSFTKWSNWPRFYPGKQIEIDVMNERCPCIIYETCKGSISRLIINVKFNASFTLKPILYANNKKESGFYIMNLKENYITKKAVKNC